MEGDVDVLAGLGISAKLDSGGHDDRAIVVGSARALTSSQAKPRRLAMIPAVTVVPLFPPQPTSIMPSLPTLRSTLKS